MADNSDAWNRFESALRDKISGGNEWKGLQLVEVPTEADWDDPEFGRYNAFVKWGDTVPKWSTAWSLTGKRASTGYWQILQNLKIAPPREDLKEKVEEAFNAYIEANDALTEIIKQTAKAWSEFNESQKDLPEPRRRSFDTWYAETYGNKIGVVRLQLQNAAERFGALWLDSGGGMADAAQALIDYNNDAYMMSAKAPDGTNLWYRTYNITPDLTSFIMESKAGKVNSIDFSFTQKTSRESKSVFSTAHKASYNVAFWGATVEGKYSDTRIDTETSEFSCEFHFRNWRLFTVSPSQWFSGSVLAAYGNGGYWNEIKPIAKGDLDPYGENGVFPLMSNQLVVAWKPKIVVKTAKDSFSDVKKSWSAAANVRVGPFKYEGSASSEKSEVEYNEEKGEIVLDSQSERPQVVAVIYNVMPAGA
jgi:hypothetical protein